MHEFKIRNLKTAIDRFYAAEAALNAFQGKVDGSPEEVEFHSAVNDIEFGDLKATNFVEAMAALKLAKKEVNSFDSVGMARVLVTTASDFFEEIGSANYDPLRDAVNMVEGFPNIEEIAALPGVAAIYDAFTLCIEGIGGITSQPRCEAGNHRLSAAGMYLDLIQEFLMFERRRIMTAAAAVTNDSQDDGNHSRTRAIMTFLAQDSDLNLKGMNAIISQLRAAEEAN